MARGNQNIHDQLFRTRGRNAAESRETTEDIRRRQIRNWIILVSVVLLVLLGIHFLGRYGKGKEIGMAKLPCYANQNDPAADLPLPDRLLVNRTLRRSVPALPPLQLIVDGLSWHLKGLTFHKKLTLQSHVSDNSQ